MDIVLYALTIYVLAIALFISKTTVLLPCYIYFVSFFGSSLFLYDFPFPLLIIEEDMKEVRREENPCACLGWRFASLSAFLHE